MRNNIRVSWVVITLLVCLRTPAIFGSELTRKDLQGFQWADTILAYKDVKLPKPKQPTHGGIQTGAVFVLGQYIPPPYEVSVEGVHVMVNGVPVTHLDRLRYTPEEREQMRKDSIIVPLQNKLFCLYQHSRWYETPEAAEVKLRQAISETKDFTLVSIDHAHNAKPNENGDVIVKMTHPQTGSFQFTVGGLEADRQWIYSAGVKLVAQRMYELMEAHPGENARIATELREFALGQPWVRQFEVVDTSRTPWPGRYNVWRLNSEEVVAPLPSLVSDWPTSEEREKKAEKQTKEFDEPNVRGALQRGSVVFSTSTITYLHGNPHLIEAIRSVVVQQVTLAEKRKQLLDILIKLGVATDLHSATEPAEYLAAFWQTLEP